VTKTHLKWKGAKINEAIGSPVAVGDNLYRLHSPDLLSCWQLSDGKVVYSERLAGVNAVTSLVATADGRIYIASGGKSFVIQAGPKLDVLSVNDLGDLSNASPAIANGRIYIRGGRNLYCIGKK
jgi:outer membrane protein assembly factor BamB